PPHRFRPAEKGKASFELEFTDYATRDAARKSLSAAGIKMRSGKTLVPLRLTGNIKWGVPAPAIGSVEQQEAAGPLSLWVWPESLWAPISFSQARLTHQAGELECLNPEVQPEGVWRDYWCDPQAQVYQFIGQDNIYFYGIAQSALWQALDESTAAARGLQQSQLVANYHLLFLDKKASSSASVKPPMAADLLALQDDQGRPLYSSDALRSHFLALGLEQKPVSFKPKPLDPAAADPKSPAGKAPDPVAKEGTFLRNVFNRLARSCFYGLQELGPDVAIPDGVSDSCKKEVETVAATYDQAMHKAELHSAQSVVTEFVRRANKQWSAEHQLADAFYRLKAGVILFAPFTPHGCQKIFEQLASPLGYQEFFCWENLFRDNLAGLRPAVLPPRSDFF
ncbi:MAG: class I tRNA ligase family protein, partial [Coriobacteriales bacterium]|nr:class I tRNA ligase family protein [Coriobacteriales bacterium]